MGVLATYSVPRSPFALYHELLAAQNHQMLLVGSAGL